MWMNEFDIEDAFDQYHNHPVLGPAVRTLLDLMLWTNSHSDGWPYWQKPSRAAKKLMELIQQQQQADRGSWQQPVPDDVTIEQVRAALRPIKAFRTRQGADFPIFDLPKGA